ncbi:MAG: class II fumarate hydratase [Acidimicrobiales bacterium]
METRTEYDSMGPVEVPAGSLWGAQTQRAVENFAISRTRLDPRLIRALALVKAAAALSNGQAGIIDSEAAAAIETAALAVAGGAHDDQFPVDVFQTGSGTSSNMNVNEVVAHLATQALGRRVHPNDHVNASQSSNDVFPSAMHLAALDAVTRELAPAVSALAGALRSKAEETAAVVKPGRTHLMDATPVTLGQELTGWASALDHSLERLNDCGPRLGQLALGGTAVGTGLNAPPGFATAALAWLAAHTGLAVTEAPDHFEAQGGRETVVELSGHLRTLAVTLARVTTDLRWMASGPATGLAEIRLVDLQPGSSIMPGKVNPVVCEAVWQVAAQVVGNDAAIAFAATAGSFELSLAMPVMAHNLMASLSLLSAGCRALANCVEGIEADVERCRRLAESSPALAAALNPLIGYDAAAAIVHHALAQHVTVAEAAVASGVPAADVARLIDVEAMTGRTDR